MRESSSLEKNDKKEVLILESPYFATSNEIADSGNDHQWWKIIAEQDGHRATKGHHACYLLIVKGVEIWQSALWSCEWPKSTDSVMFLLMWCW